MPSDPLEALWKSIVPLSELRKSRRDDLLDASNAIHPPLAPVDKVATTRRMQQDYAMKTVEKLTERIEELIESVKNLNGEQKLGNGKMNSLVDQTIEQAGIIVNRAQERVLTAVGQPAQANILQEVLESQRVILGIIETIQQQTMTMQTTQANLQASLITLIAQSQQISSQIMLVEADLSQKLESIKENVIFQVRRKRSEEEDKKVEKRRRTSRTQGASQKPHALLGPRSSPPILPNSTGRSQTSSSSLSSPLYRENDRNETPLSPPLSADVLGTRPLIGFDGPLPPYIDGRMKKAQKLASFFGDAESIEESGCDDLFSKLERL
ncbi:hypothetical protein FRC14_006160 [Serendipita sp. 396]|nr:hypothetical protein FRC14_006160 [Serendipita sp. 396]KAG8834859.1 hypothetical protein FRC18_001392 [Serendipita sp. 400]